MPAATQSPDCHHENREHPSQRLILCFDGTGNDFKGSPGDTNIVKLYNMLDRSNHEQLHYYQPGIGTYPAEGPVNVGLFRSIYRKVEAKIDEGFATSFDAHVIAGYRFLMRYYSEGDRIYVFGFSRGAFTARFLARMISHIGLLSKGNEELVPFAYKVYQQYEQNRGTAADEKKNAAYMNAFKKHFCRTEREAALGAGSQITENESGVKVHFLGLFDCVNSVGNLDFPLLRKAPPLPAVRGTACHVRHAVAIDERRVKFKAALFAQEQTEVPEDIKEVWFPGNHGDIGGGWDVPTKGKEDAPSTNVNDDYFQLSDITLKWMVDEIDDVEKDESEEAKFAWNRKEKISFLHRFDRHKDEMISAKLHNTMSMSGGSDTSFKFGTLFKVGFWWCLEYFPFIKRWEYVRDTSKPPVAGGYKWDYVWQPLNMGRRRSIPSTALFHHAVIRRMGLVNKSCPDYSPNNHLWVKRGGKTASFSQQPGAPLAEKRLDDLAKEYKNHAVNGIAHDSSTGVQFEKDERLTRGSVDVGDESIVVGPTEWDGIYRVVMD